MSISGGFLGYGVEFPTEVRKLAMIYLSQINSEILETSIFDRASLNSQANTDIIDAFGGHDLNSWGLLTAVTKLLIIYG